MTYWRPDTKVSIDTNVCSPLSSGAPKIGIMTETVPHLRIIEETSAYWRVLFDHPPLNIVGVGMFEGLQDLLARMDASPSLRVVVFESANPDFYLPHFDLTGKIGNVMTALGV